VKARVQIPVPPKKRRKKEMKVPSLKNNVCVKSRGLWGLLSDENGTVILHICKQTQIDINNYSSEM
jgi:hypothetical protein